MNVRIDKPMEITKGTPGVPSLEAPSLPRRALLVRVDGAQLYVVPADSIEGDQVLKFALVDGRPLGDTPSVFRLRNVHTFVTVTLFADGSASWDRGALCRAAPANPRNDSERVVCQFGHALLLDE